MPSTIAKLNPLILKLALRAPLSKTKEDWQLHSPVDDLYNNDMKILMEAHCKQLGSEIALSDGIQKAASQLLDKYGPVLWPNQEHRPWLLGVGETFKGVGLCARSCRWDDRDDREYLRETFHALCVARTQRHRKQIYRSSIRDSPQLPDTSADSSYSPIVSTSKFRATNHSSALHCFATHTEDHNDATRLEQIGIWLGDYHEEAATVNGASQHDVEKSYFESTAGGIDCSKAEPWVFDQFSGEQYAVECAAGKTSPSTATEKLSLEAIEFSWVNDDESGAEERTHIQKHALIYRCRLRGREVFAFVKPLSERETKRVDLKITLWSFWKLDGGYTSRCLLARMHSNATTPLLRPDVVPVASTTGTQTWTTTAERPSTIPRDTSSPWACLRERPSMSGSKSSKETATDPGTSKAQTTSGGPAMRSSLNGIHHDERQQHPVGKRRRLSFDSMYDVTPPEQRNVRPLNTSTTSHKNSQKSRYSASVLRQSHSNTEPIVEQRESSSRFLANNPLDPGETNQSDGSGALFTTTRFKVWFTFDSSVGAARRVVILDNSLSFDAAFAHVKEKLARKINGKSLAAVFLKFDTGTMLEVDEEATWQEVVGMVKETGKAELEGTVELE